jgi:SSS family solute:Na+ symporter
MSLSMAGILLKQIDSAWLAARADDNFAWGALDWLHGFTGQEMTFWAIAVSVTTYILVSLLGPRRVFDMDRMLHRGRHAIAGESSVSWSDARSWREKLGISREFTRADRIITYITIGWPAAWTVVFVIGTIHNLVVDVPDPAWVAFWRIWTWLILTCAVSVTIWFTIGGARDLRDLYRRLHALGANVAEDGRVEDRRNVGE